MKLKICLAAQSISRSLVVGWSVLSGIQRRKQEDKPDPIWNLGKPEATELYERLTDEAHILTKLTI